MKTMYATMLLGLMAVQMVLADVDEQASPTIGKETEGLVVFDGEWQQGAMIKGKLLVRGEVEVLGRKVYVDPEGEFVFGLGRDAPGIVEVAIKTVLGAHRIKSKVAQREYPTQRIEGVEQRYVEPPQEVLARIRKESASIKKARDTFDERADFKGGFVWPLKGAVTGVYGSQRIYNGVPKRPHYGLDIAAPEGTSVTAPAPGVVRLAHNDMYYSGGTLIVDHGQGISSTFIHLSEILVEEGAQIATGQPIAKVGSTGRSTGPHLDWRINWFNQRLDPAMVLPDQASSP